MTVPYTNTNILDYIDFRDETEHYSGHSLNELVHPVRRVRVKRGDDPQQWEYFDEVLDLDFIMRWVLLTGNDPMTREPIVWDMYEDVQWSGGVEGALRGEETIRILNDLKRGQAVIRRNDLPPPIRFVRNRPREQRPVPPQLPPNVQGPLEIAFRELALDHPQIWNDTEPNDAVLARRVRDILAARERHRFLDRDADELLALQRRQARRHTGA